MSFALLPFCFVVVLRFAAVVVVNLFAISFSRLIHAPLVRPRFSRTPTLLTLSFLSDRRSTLDDHTHNHIRHTTTNQRVTALPMARSCAEQEKWLPRFKKRLPIHRMNMCHKTKLNLTHNGSMHQETTKQGTTQHTIVPQLYPWQGHALNGKSGYLCSKSGYLFTE
ncbi:hypothetical protein ACSQ67_023935 [Phaseolus vulgaris]